MPAPLESSVHYSSVFYITFEDDRLYVVKATSRMKDFTPAVWYQRAIPVQEMNLVRDKISCGFSTVFILVSDPGRVGPYVTHLFDCHRIFKVGIVFELSILNTRASETDWNYPYCFLTTSKYFKDIQDLRLGTFKMHFFFENMFFSFYKGTEKRDEYIQSETISPTYCFNDSGSKTFWLYHLNRNHNRNFEVTAVILSHYIRMTREEKVRVCSRFQMSPLIIRGKQDLSGITESIKSSLPLLASSTNYSFVFGLNLMQYSVGQRYSWGKEKDPLLSHWASGEPRDMSTLRCAYWKFTFHRDHWVDEKWHTAKCDVERKTVLCQENIPAREKALRYTSKLLINNTEPRDMSTLRCAYWKFTFHRDHWVDEKWHTAKCDVERKTVLCQENIPAREKALRYTSKLLINNTEVLAKGYIGQLYMDGTREKGVFVSMSAAIASGYLHGRWGDLHGLKIPELVSYGSLGLISMSDHHDLVEQLRPLFHQCNENKETNSHHPWGVPLSFVCDGKRDCRSGSDEASCEYIGGVVCGPNTFQCASSQCVPSEVRCDLISDCQDRSDEKDCKLECQHKECRSGQCLPRSWFHDGLKDCKHGDDETGAALVGDTCMFICNRTKCVTNEMLNNSVVDCTGPEGPLDETLGALEPFNCTTKVANSLYKWAPKCVLARDLFGQIIGCRDFQHLSECENFTCPEGYVKCPNSFCIPLVNVRDGKEECDEGEDEGIDPLPDLKNYFQCGLWKHPAVPLSAVCDGSRDCPYGEDELDCGHHCPTGFICLAGAVSVFGYNKTHPLRNLSFIQPDTRYLDLSGVKVRDFFTIYPLHHLGHLRSLILRGCQIRTVLRSPHVVAKSGSNRCFDRGELHIQDFQMLQYVDLSHNHLDSLPGRTHLNLMPNLETLNLSQNVPLKSLSRASFTNLKRLKVLDLSFTGLTRLSPDVWVELDSLEQLSLKGTRIVSITFTLPATTKYLNVELINIADVGGKVFSKVRGMRKIRASTYRLCCPAVLGPEIPSHICGFTGSAFSACRELIKEPALRVVVWLVGLSTLAGNTVTLVYRLAWSREVLKNPYGMFVTNLGMSDLLMGVYLLMIAVADAMFYGEYVIHDYTWRYSPVCQAAGVLVTMSSLTSIMFISLITVERYLAVRYPYGEVRLSQFTVKAAVLVSWTFGLIAAVLPLMPFARYWEVFSSNGMCLALPLSTERRPGQWYGATLFVGIDLILFIFIGVGQGVIYRTVKEKGKRTRKHSNPHSQLRHNQKLQEFAVAKQLSLVVMTDFLCWFPIITMGLMALSGVDLGDAAYRWSALLVLPINSALNPALYTVPEIRKRWQDYKEARRQARMLKAAASRRRRFRNKSVVKKVSRRKLLLRSCRALVNIRQEMLSRPQQILKARADWEILYAKVLGLKSVICSRAA